jgi:hypothetical protein
MATVPHYQRPDDLLGMSPQVRSTVSIVAILAAIGSFIFAARGHEALGIFSALLAVGAGLIGGVKSLSPRVSGGMLSLAAVALGLIGLVFSIVAIFF